MDSSASKRLAVLENHVLGRGPNPLEEQSQSQSLSTSWTSSPPTVGGLRDGYCAILPERLTPADPWLVRR